MPISTRLFVRSTLAMLAIGFGALCVIVASTVWLGERARALSEQVIAARDGKATAVELRAALQTAESSQRGFLYTGNQVYLAPYDQAKARANAAAAALPAALAGYSGLTPALDRLTAVLGEKVAEMDQTIALKQSGQEQEALSMVRTNRGKLLMDEANVFLAGIGLATDQRLADLVDEQTENAVWLRLVSVLGGLVILGVAALAIYTVLKYTQELREARNDLARSNERLEQRVADRTQDLAQANNEMREARDRAELLLAEVNHRVANSLTLVSSMIGIQSRALDNEAAREALGETQARVQAIAMVHKRLYDSSDVREVALDEYLAGLLDQFKTTMGASGGVSLRYAFEPLKLKTDASINLGVVVTEWVMNAMKYAYPGRKGEVRVILARGDDGFGILRVEDDGVGRDEGAPAHGTGLGSRIVKAMAASMGGTVEYLPRAPGMAASLAFPVAAA